MAQEYTRELIVREAVSPITNVMGDFKFNEIPGPLDAAGEETSIVPGLLGSDGKAGRVLRLRTTSTANDVSSATLILQPKPVKKLTAYLIVRPCDGTRMEQLDLEIAIDADTFRARLGLRYTEDYDAEEGAIYLETGWGTWTLLVSGLPLLNAYAWHTFKLVADLNAVKYLIVERNGIPYVATSLSPYKVETTPFSVQAIATIRLTNPTGGINIAYIDRLTVVAGE